MVLNNSKCHVPCIVTYLAPQLVLESDSCAHIRRNVSIRYGPLACVSELLPQESFRVKCDLDGGAYNARIL